MPNGEPVKSSHRLTVFTATYNRVGTLPRLYESLKRQTSMEFLWLIVDDGSTDETSDLISKYINESILHIEYVSQANKGQQNAINTGLEHLKTELFYKVDSVVPAKAICSGCLT